MCEGDSRSGARRPDLLIAAGARGDPNRASFATHLTPQDEFSYQPVFNQAMARSPGSDTYALHNTLFNIITCLI